MKCSLLSRVNVADQAHPELCVSSAGDSISKVGVAILERRLAPFLGVPYTLCGACPAVVL